jgi:multidrug efflux pump subunit AcrA (membrane-fusion protein)
VLALSLGIYSASSAQTSAPLPTAIDDCRIRLVEQVVIASDRSGLLVALPFSEGERVAAASIVARMADALPAAQLRLAQAKASSDVIIRQHRVELEMAQTELQKSEEANAKAKASSRTVIAVPELELVKLRLTIRKAELEIERATHELEVATKECALAQAEVDALQLKAPFAGIVNRCYRSVGEVIKPGDPVVEIVNPDKLRIEGRIPWAMLPLVQVGQSVRVSPQLEPSSRKPGKLKSAPQAPLENHSAEGSAETPSVSGVIGFIDATSDPVTHETRFWVEVRSGSAWLRPGLRARVEPVEQPVAAVSP